MKIIFSFFFILFIIVSNSFSQSMSVHTSTGTDVFDISDIDSITFDLSYEIPTDSLIAYYPFNGNANDMSGNENHGTINNVLLTKDRFDNENSAYYFDGNSYITIPGLQLCNSESATISLWLQTDSLEKNSSAFYNGDNGEIAITVDKNSFSVSVKLANQVWYEDTLFTSNSGWIHIVNRWQKGKTLELFLNGKLMKSSELPDQFLLDPGPVYQSAIGSYSPNHTSIHFIGKIDDVRVYNCALSPFEIELLFNEKDENN